VPNPLDALDRVINKTVAPVSGLPLLGPVP
jgi:hypothetical protein